MPKFETPIARAFPGQEAFPSLAKYRQTSSLCTVSSVGHRRDLPGTLAQLLEHSKVLTHAEWPVQQDQVDVFHLKLLQGLQDALRGVFMIGVA